MIERSRVVWIAAVSIASAACGESLPSTMEVADSAGVEVVSNLTGSAGGASTWLLGSEPTLEIGEGADADVPLYQVTAVTPLGSGGVAVGTTVPPRVLVFDGNGAPLATLGREGEGPGEFASVGSVVELPGDSIAVWDPDRRRLSIFDPSGVLARELDLSEIAPVSARASSSAQTASGFTHVLPWVAGSLVLFGEAALGPGSDPVITRHTMPAYRIAADGDVLASFGSFPGMQTSPGLPTPFGARTHAGSGDGFLVVGTSEATEFRRYAADGDLAQIVRWPDNDRTVAGPFLDRWIAMTEANSSLGEYIRSQPRAEAFPAYDDLLVSDDGHVWVADYPGPLGVVPLRRADQAPEALKPTLRMPARRWLIFGPDGALSAELTTPEGFEPYALRGEALWGVYTDGLDVESVRAYAVAK